MGFHHGLSFLLLLTTHLSPIKKNSHSALNPSLSNANIGTVRVHEQLEFPTTLLPSWPIHRKLLLPHPKHFPTVSAKFSIAVLLQLIMSSSPHQPQQGPTKSASRCSKFLFSSPCPPLPTPCAKTRGSTVFHPTRMSTPSPIMIQAMNLMKKRVPFYLN